MIGASNISSMSRYILLPPPYIFFICSMSMKKDHFMRKDHKVAKIYKEKEKKKKKKEEEERIREITLCPFVV